MGIKIGSFFMPYYGFFIVLGLIIAALVGVFQIKRFKKDIDEFIILAATAGLGGVIGAKLLYLIVSWQTIDFHRITDLSYFSSLMGGGFVFYGGLLGGIAGILLCRRQLTGGLLSYVKICIPCLPIAHGFGRFGCYFVGCCYGIPFHSVFSVVYHQSSFAPNEVALFPVQLAEAIGNLLIAVILLVYIDVLKRDESVFLYVFLYAPLRFFLEFFRDDTARGHVGFLSVSQWISFFLVLSTVVLFHFQKKEHLPPV